HDVVPKLNESAVPTLLARANHSRRLGVPRPALVDLRMDVARQRPGALNGPSVGDRLLTDDLGALKHCVPQGLAADLLGHEFEPAADVLRGWAPESYRHSHAGLSSWQSNWSSSRRPVRSRTAWISNSRPSNRTRCLGSMPRRQRMVIRWSAWMCDCCASK